MTSNGKFGLLGNKMSFGTPSYPSPLDRIRTGKQERGAMFGRITETEASFEANQSFPKTTKTNLCLDETMSKPKGRSKRNDRHKQGSDGLFNQVSYSPGHCKGTFQSPDEGIMNSSLGENWSFYNYVGGGQSGVTFPTTVNNPNKAVCTINAKTSEILVANEMACELFGFESDELIGKELKQLIRLKPKDQSTILESHLEENTGEVINVSGRVVDAVDSNGLIMPISLWTKKIGNPADCRCLVVMEPVDRTVAMVTFDSKGTVLSCDHKLANLYGFISPDEVEGLELRQLIPSMRLPCPGHTLTKEIRKQRATGRTCDGASFPLSIFIKLATEVEEDSRNVPPGINNLTEDIYLGIIWVFSSISGLITLGPDGTILTINHNFALMLFGYSASSLIGKDISVLIPDFYDIMELEEGECGESVYDVSSHSRSHSSQYQHVLDVNDGDSSDDQGLGSSLTSSQYQGRKSDHRVDCPLLGPGVTSTPDKNLPDTYFRKAMDKEKGACNIVPEISPLVNSDSVKDPLATKLELNSESDEEVQAPILKLNALSPTSCCSADVSASSMETVPTAREVIRNAAGQEEGNRMVGSPEKEGEIRDNGVQDSIASQENGIEDCMVSQHKGYSEKDLDNIEKIILEEKDEKCNTELCAQSTVDIQSEVNNDSLSISASTEELLTAKVGEMNLNNSVGKLNGSTVSDQLDSSDPQILPQELIADEYCQNSSLDSFIKNEQEFSCASQGEDGGCNILNGNNSSGKSVENSVCSESDMKESSLKKHRQPLSPDLSKNDKYSPSSSGSGYRSSICGQDLSSDRGSFSPRKHNRGRHSDPCMRRNYENELLGDSVFPEGSYAGQCRHQDGSFLGIIFQLKRVELGDGSAQYCMWVSRDPEEVAEGGRSYANLTLASSLNSTMDRSNVSQNFSLGELLSDKAASESKIIDDNKDLIDDEEDDNKENEDPALRVSVKDKDGLSPGRGLYDLRYHTFNSIGKGAFGFVKLARRKSDNQQVVVKFIKKNKVLSECWTKDSKGKVEPLEVSLLCSLNHPNIVKVLDVFENDDYIQMVMEKHGSGMDLFEFIDRAPLLDEALASYIFRQIVSAVSYLHGLSILHRDIKDENVILNERFQIKLIDFGAAAYMYPGKLFGTFCGTMEYCSPEVLMGNKYPGPELEVWSMGVTLYTLVFGENPFFDVDETVKGELKPPFDVSRALFFLLRWLLNPDPKKRATIRDCERDLWTNQPIDISQYSWEEVLPNSEFHGNTAADNRIDSPETKTNQNYGQQKGGYLYTSDAYFKPHPAYSPPGYDAHIGGRPWRNEIPY
ncbi:hypothetical protein FSP39_020640 [Pinctada imbricata]|uniref:PAS domain-containing serine/threonine-protein kinase n=1 Tax=Pinctada imbricata TaxID=66713 RepID=A0AA88XNG2_PINIB|nr:hypothetical protein FSP39_020640 [Pinctada imbricata]